MTNNKHLSLLFTTCISLINSTSFAASKAPNKITVASSPSTTIGDNHTNNDATKKVPVSPEKLSDLPLYFVALTNLVAQQPIQQPFIDWSHPDPMYSTWLMRDEVSSKLLPWKNEVDGKICELLATTFGHSQWFMRYTTIHVGLTAINYLELSLYNNGQMSPTKTLLSTYETAIGQLRTGWQLTSLEGIATYNEGEIAAPNGKDTWLLWLKKTTPGRNEHSLITYVSKKLGLANSVICGPVYNTKPQLKGTIYLWIAADALAEFNRKFEMNLSHRQNKAPLPLRSSL